MRTRVYVDAVACQRTGAHYTGTYTVQDSNSFLKRTGDPFQERENTFYGLRKNVVWPDEIKALAKMLVDRGKTCTRKSVILVFTGVTDQREHDIYLEFRCMLTL